MGNNIGGRRGSNKSAKIMKINGDYFKLKTPVKVIDIIKDYPNHILLDSEDFLLYNLRGKPLTLDYELKPKKIYLLFELPKFPENTENIVVKSPLRRVRSSNSRTKVKDARMLMLKRLISDLPKTIFNDDDHVGGGRTRVKVKLPKAEVNKILEQSNDDVEIAQRILKLLATVHGGDAVEEGGGREKVVMVVEEDEDDLEVEVMDRLCFNIHTICGSQNRKYTKLSP